MRLLMVSHVNNPWTEHYARFFAERYDAFQLLSFSPGTLQDLDVVHVGPRNWGGSSHKHVYLTAAGKVRRIIRAFEPDLIFAPYIPSNGLAAALSWSGPIVTSAVGSDLLGEDRQRGLPGMMHRAVARYVCRRCAVIQCVSQELCDFLIRLGIPAEKLLLLSVGADARQFKPAPDMPRNPPRRLTCIRRHEPVYDIATVVEALGRLRDSGRDFECTLAGDGSLRPQHEARVAALGLDDRVRFVGMVDHDDLPALLQQADIYITASHRDGTSVSLLEALAVGLAPVASDILANRDWVDHGRTGLLFKTGNIDSLFESLAQALDTPKICQRAVAENPELVRTKGDTWTNTEILAQVFEKIVAGDSDPIPADRRPSPEPATAP